MDYSKVANIVATGLQQGGKQRTNSTTCARTPMRVFSLHIKYKHAHIGSVSACKAGLGLRMIKAICAGYGLQSQVCLAAQIFPMRNSSSVIMR